MLLKYTMLYFSLMVLFFRLGRVFAFGNFISGCLSVIQPTLALLLQSLLQIRMLGGLLTAWKGDRLNLYLINKRYILLISFDRHLIKCV